MMMMRLRQYLMTAAFVMVAGAASAQDTRLLTYDISMRSALQMHGSTFVLPPGEYRLEQVDLSTPGLFVLRKKDMAGNVVGEPLAILDAWRVPYYDGGLDTSGVKLVTDPEEGGVAVLKGWQIGPDYWRMRDIAALDLEHFSARE